MSHVAKAQGSTLNPVVADAPAKPFLSSIVLRAREAEDEVRRRFDVIQQRNRRGSKVAHGFTARARRVFHSAAALTCTILRFSKRFSALLFVYRILFHVIVYAYVSLISNQPTYE